MKRIGVTLATLLITASVYAGQNTTINPEMVQQGINYVSKHLGDWFSNQTGTPTAQTTAHMNTTSHEPHGRLIDQEAKLERDIAERDALKRQLINKQEEINKERATISAEKHRAAIHPHNAGHQHGTMTDALKDKFGNWLTDQIAQYQ